MNPYAQKNEKKEHGSVLQSIPSYPKLIRALFSPGLSVNLMETAHSIFTYAKQAAQSLIQKGDSVVVGLSGGPDSVFLLHVLSNLLHEGHIGSIIAAHLDHEWRLESKNDLQFCVDLCKSLSIPLKSGTLAMFKAHIVWNGSKEAFARDARQLFFEQVRTSHDAQWIALGHHMQDQQETFFMRMLRGTSISGLCGMKQKNGFYIRPLLHISKDTILAWLNAHGIQYCIDQSNQSDQFLRNRIRHHIIPACKASDQRFDQSFATMIRNVQEAEAYLAEHTAHIFATIYTQNNEFLFRELLKLPPFMQKRLLLYWFDKNNIPFSPSDALLEEIIRFLQSPHGGTHSVHPHWKLQKLKSVCSLIHN